MRILLVEDEAAISAHVKTALEATDYVVETVMDGEAAWFRASTEEYDAVVLDLGLPRLDGLSVVRRLRDEGSLIPILILTVRATWLQRVEGIDAGADDYLTKPFEMEELIARLGALLRRVGRYATPMIQVGELRIDTRRLRVFLGGCTVELSPLEFRLLRYLAHHRGRVVSLGELVEHIYGSDEPDRNAVEALVARLRRKVGADAIATRRGHGYMMEG